MKKQTPTTISVYWEKELQKEAKKKAAAQDMSLSQYLRFLVRRDIQQAQPAK